MSKTVSCRLSDEKYDMFIQKVRQMNTTNNIIIESLIDIFVNVNNRKQPVNNVFDESEYEIIKRKVDELIGRYNWIYEDSNYE